MTLLIDNYDSFAYNLYQYIGTIDPAIRVIRNDELPLDDIERLEPDRIIISPGPGKPCDAGCIEGVIKHFLGRVPILGVCLGHQALCEALGARIVPANRLMHGKQSRVALRSSCALFAHLPTEILVARYHSLAVDRASLPSCLEVCAEADDGEIMAVQHQSACAFGLQFHPESIMTPDGMSILENFMRLRL